MARRLLDEGLAARRMRQAVEAYRAGRVTAWRAARIAGVSPYEMLDLIHEAGIPHELDPEVLEGLTPTRASRGGTPSSGPNASWP